MSIEAPEDSPRPGHASLRGARGGPIAKHLILCLGPVGSGDAARNLQLLPCTDVSGGNEARFVLPTHMATPAMPFTVGVRPGADTGLRPPTTPERHPGSRSALRIESCHDLSHLKVLAGGEVADAGTVSLAIPS